MSQRTNLRRYIIKKKLIEICGGGCKICGYNKCVGALDFHHRDPTQKKFSLNNAINSGFAWQNILEEVDKCDLLCCRCHREEEYIEPEVPNLEKAFESFKKTKHVDVLGKKEGVPKKEELQELLKVYSTNEIAKSFDVCKRTVRYWRIKYNLKINKINKSIRIPSKEELQNLIMEKTAVIIGREFNVTDKAVKKWLNKYNIKNPRSEIFGRKSKQIPWEDWAKRS